MNETDSFAKYFALVIFFLVFYKLYQGYKRRLAVKKQLVSFNKSSKVNNNLLIGPF